MVVYNLNSKSKIGIFDSGLGGISVLYDVHKVLPNESIVYYGDSKNAPYGVKSKEEVLKLSKDICDRFIEEGVKAIVIACNTATSAAVDVLRTLYDVPIIGMEPAIKPAIIGSKGTILVLATEMTLKEDKFNRLVESFEEAHRIIKMPAPLLVDVVENHMDDENKIRQAVAYYLDQVNGPIDSIVLGCTHYIFLRKQIEDYFDYKIDIYDGNMGTACHLKNILNGHDLLNDDQAPGQIYINNSSGEEYIKKSHEMLEYLRKRDLYDHRF